MTLEGILFDLDGTLIDTYRLYLEAYRRALEPYLGYSPGIEEFIARRPSSERRFLAEWIGAQDAAECHAAMCRHYEELHGALCEGMYEGVREMLGALRAAGLPAGIVTGKGRRAWEVTAASIELGTFRTVVTDDDVAEPKPHPEGLLSAAADLELEPSAILYVGDSLADLEAGRRAGMRTGAALWPKTDPSDRAWFMAEAPRQRPDWVFERPGDVTRALVRWC